MKALTFFRANIEFVKVCCNHYSTTNNVRVRFAPSPTGFLHLGGLRTALYNYLYAKSRNGVFILRIEDTDRTRLVEGATEKLEEDLKWVGIIPDEGPSVGGQYGPYLQSQRSDLYEVEVKKLLENGSAYRCFCSSTRLDLLRREALRRREVPKYDNRCRSLTSAQVQEKLDAGILHCIRFKLTPLTEPFQDLIYGPIKHNVAEIEGDPVILKSDGFPTYHLANVVDDHYMEVSHVLRGVEWQNSTSKHLLLYNAFGWTPPQYAHLPLLLNADGTKLSKRQRDITVESYRNDGILPIALVNFVVSCGGGFVKKHAADLECKTMHQLAENFELNLINENSCCVNYDLLPQYNRAELKKLVQNESSLQELTAHVRRLVKNSYGDSSSLKDEQIHRVLRWCVDRISKLNDLVGPDMRFVWMQPNLEDMKKYEVSFFDALIPLIEEIKELENTDRNSMGPFLKSFAEKHNLKYSEFMKFLRSALSGLKVGPSIGEMSEMLGKEDTLNRLRAVLKLHQSKKENVASGAP